MSTTPEQKQPAPKAPERDTVRRELEIETIKRTLYNAIDKLDRLKVDKK